MLRLVVILGVVMMGVGSKATAGSDHQNQGYFQYANVPAAGQYEFGYNRGNPYHYTSRYEQGHNWRFRSKVRWGDKNSGYGEHYYDYNHIDKGGDRKGKGHSSVAGHVPQLGWSSTQAQQGSYSELKPAVVTPAEQNQLNTFR